jgi:hypothetical protein
MNVSELSFDEFESGGENLELVNEFFECVEEPPIPASRVYKGKGGKHYTAYEFGLCEGVDRDTIVFKDDNHLVGYEPDDSRYSVPMSEMWEYIKN